MDTLKIFNTEYQIIDTVEKLTVPDCFVLRANKIGSGNGEAKFYIGNDSDKLRDFYGNDGFRLNAFVLKRDFVSYMNDVKEEYLNPEQPYRQKDKMPELWNTRSDVISNLDDALWLNIEEQDWIERPRIYIKSTDYAYTLLRELALPNISYLSIIKLFNVSQGYVYYFRLFADYFGENLHPAVVEREIVKIEEQQNINKEEKAQIVRARTGQGKYRAQLLEECPRCPITLVSDDRLLIASHIKPWIDSNEHEKIDSKNGFMFTPTYDFLFDRGYISFTDEKRLMISPWISKLTCNKLNIAPDKQYNMLPIEGREIYLKYHREKIFKG